MSGLKDLEEDYVFLSVRVFRGEDTFIWAKPYSKLRKGVVQGTMLGSSIGVIQGDTRSLDYSSGSHRHQLPCRSPVGLQVYILDAGLLTVWQTE